MNIKKSVMTAAVTAIGFFAAAAQASPINVGGVNWDPDSALDFSSFSIAIHQDIDAATGVVSGFGIISTINGDSAAVFAPGMELTFTFGGFTPLASGALPTSPGQAISYTGGVVNVFIDDTPEISNPSNPTTLNAANTGDGTLWLSLAGHTFGGSTFTGTVNGASTISSLTGSGLLDVVGGLAAGNFDTNTQLGGADLSFSDSFTLFLPAGQVLSSYGTGNFFGDTIPEPGSLFLAGLGLFGLAFSRRSRKS